LFGGAAGEKLKKEIQLGRPLSDEVELTPAQLNTLQSALQRAIAAARSADEVAQIEAALSSGTFCASSSSSSLFLSFSYFPRLLTVVVWSQQGACRPVC
jgi:hypothetical protein